MGFFISCFVLFDPFWVQGQDATPAASKFFIKILNREIPWHLPAIQLNGVSLHYSETEARWEGDIVLPSQVTLVVNCVGYEGVRIKFWPSVSAGGVTQSSIRMGAKGSYYVRSENHIVPIQPDSFHIGLIQTNANVKLGIPELLESYRLEVVPIQDDQMGSEYPTQYPYVVVQNQDHRPFLKMEDEKIQGILDAGYQPGIFLRDITAGISTFPLVITFRLGTDPEEIDTFLSQNSLEKTFQNGLLVTAIPKNGIVIGLEVIPLIEKMLASPEPESIWFTDYQPLKLH